MIKHACRTEKISYRVGEFSWAMLPISGRNKLPSGGTGPLFTQADYLSRQCLNRGDPSLYPEGFSQICLRWGMMEVDLLLSHLNRKSEQICDQDQELLADAPELLWYALIYGASFPKASSLSSA